MCTDIKIVSVTDDFTTYVTKIRIFIYNPGKVALNGTSKFSHYNIIIYSAKMNSPSELSIIYNSVMKLYINDSCLTLNLRQTKCRNMLQ